jgi:hypothetical protein
MILSLLPRADRDMILSYGPHAAARLLDAMGGTARHPAGAVVGAVPASTTPLPSWTWEQRSALDFRGKTWVSLASLRVSKLGGVVPAGAPVDRRAAVTSFVPNIARAMPGFPAPEVVGPRGTIDEVLASCPTAEEVATIDRDFPHIYIEAGAAVAPMSCVPGAEESSIPLTVYNIFRGALTIEFDAPMPLLGTTNLYRWLRDQNLTFRFVHGASEGRDRVLTMGLPPSTLLPYLRTWDGFAWGTGMGSMLGLVVHEGRHATTGLIHNCIPNDGLNANIDVSLNYGGAWAAEYWFYRWMTEHTGPILSPTQKANTAAAARNILLNSFCDRRGGGIVRT